MLDEAFNVNNHIRSFALHRNQAGPLAIQLRIVRDTEVCFWTAQVHKTVAKAVVKNIGATLSRKNAVKPFAQFRKLCRCERLKLAISCVAFTGGDRVET